MIMKMSKLIVQSNQEIIEDKSNARASDGDGRDDDGDGDAFFILQVSTC